MIARNLLTTSLLFALLMVLPLSAQINFVQRNYATSNPSGSSLRVTFPAAQTAGNLNIVAVGWNDTRAAVSSVVDSRGNSYLLAVGPTLGSALTQSVYYAKNIAGGSNTVTVTFNQTAAYPDVRVLEYSGADPTNPLDVTAAAMGNSKSPSSGPATITTSSELIFGAGMTFDAFSGAGSGFNNRVITNFGDIAEDATVLSMGRYSATAPLRSSAPWVMQMATFRGRQGISGTPAPALTSITPNSGPTGGGTAITIQGTGFQTGATVSLGGTAATNVAVGSSTSITATVAPHVAGSVDVVVANTDGQFGTLANAYTYNVASGTISFVQGNSAILRSGSAVAIAYPVTQTAGNLNVVSVMWGDTTSAISSVTDSQGNSYALAAGPAMATTLTSAIYYAKNIASGSNTITVRFNQTASFPNVNVLEYSGLDTTNPLDVTSNASGYGTAANSGSATTTAANELIVGAGNPSSVFTSAGGGFTNRMINSFGGISEDRIVSSPGSYSATAAMTSGTWVMQMATFRAGGQNSPDAQAVHTYTTNFPLTENPLSEGGNWIEGGDVGLDWTNMRTTAGFAFATQSGTNSGDAMFDDSIALLPGAWGDDQSAQATIKIVKPITAGGSCYQESELLLRGNISAHNATFYEVNVGDRSDSDSYIHVVRWNGPLADFTTLLTLRGITYGVKTGDIFKATIVGNTITIYINGVVKGKVTDSTFASGNPGIGMYIQSPSTCGSGNSNFGFSSFTASDQ